MSNPNYKYIDGKIKVKIDDLWIEPNFERYESFEPIGEPGANGVVIKGIHKITKREDAIKIWLPRRRNGKDELRVDQYMAEVQKIAKLSDPRIATIHDAWTENGCYCCSMEYINGITYEKWLEENCDMGQRINMLMKIFDAIVFYQSQGIIHGDIHSKNILIEQDGEIHIIDFGTSSLSSYKEQSIHRENFLMYELVEKTLEDQFDKNVFLIKKYTLRDDVTNSDDIRTAIPIFFAKSIISYLHLLIMLNNCRDIINEPEYIYEYCRNIAKGYYLNMDYFYYRISDRSEQTVDKFTNIMFESLEDEEYENAQNNISEADRMEYISLFVYYEVIKNELQSGKIREEVLIKYINDGADLEQNEIVKIFNEHKDLFGFHSVLLERLNEYEEIHSIETDLRIALFNTMKESYGGYLLHILRYIHMRMSELKLQSELCDKIVKLSYMYCFNNGIEYPSDDL